MKEVPVNCPEAVGQCPGVKISALRYPLLVYNVNILNRQEMPDCHMIPNRIVRYFFSLQYALFRSGCIRFATYKTGIIHFYEHYLRPRHYLNNPAYYPATYGRN